MAAGLNLTEGSAPATPGANTHNLYVDSGGAWHILSDAAADRVLADNTVEFATANVADAAITNAKLAHMVEATIKGRAAGAGTGDVTDLTVAELVTLLADEFTETESDPAWTAFTLDGWFTTPTLYPVGHTYAVPGYRKIGGVVYLRGMARVGTASTPIGTLPVGYRPSHDAMYAGHRATSGTPVQTIIWIYADGRIFKDDTANASYHLDGICFVPAD